MRGNAPNDTECLSADFVAALGLLVPRALVDLHAAVTSLARQHDHLGNHQLCHAARVGIPGGGEKAKGGRRVSKAMGVPPAGGGPAHGRPPCRSETSQSVDSRRVEHGDGLLRRHLEVSLVRADAEAANAEETLGGVEDPGGELGLAANADCDNILDDLHQLVLRVPAKGAGGDAGVREGGR